MGALNERSFRLYMVALCAAGMGLLVLLSVMASDGHLIYALDDPYIHLAVAENILRGGYGVNLPEYSAPSSSVLWPWLLSLLLAVGLGSLGPLLLGAIGSLGLSWVAAPILFRHAVLSGTAPRIWLFWLLPPCFLLATNAPALPMTGMEHPLHLFAVALVVAGLIDLGEGRRVPPGLVAGTVLSGLIRFEGLALSLAVVAVLLLARRPWPALLAFGVLAAGLLAHLAFMTGAGLPLVPSSVLMKSAIVAGLVESTTGSFASDLIYSLYESLTSDRGVVLAMAAAALIPVLLTGSGPWPLAAATVAALAAHLAFGQYGWFGRYEAYAIALAILSLAYYFGRPLAATGALPLLLLAISTSFVTYTVLTPAASRNVYQQQYQMHRFATEFFPEPVAVNDLGWVAYRNDRYVLDLWGLGSEVARTSRYDFPSAGPFLREMAARHGVAFAMIYPRWFIDDIPGEWCRIADLRTSQISSAYEEVSFYLIDRDLEGRMRDALDRFGPTLPAGASLEAHPCG